VSEPREFRAVYKDAIDYGFAALGSHISRVVSDYLTRKYGLTPTNTVESPVLLSEALEKTLGYGSILIETRIVRSLNQQLSLPLAAPPVIRMGHPEDFEAFVRKAQKSAVA
jgi:hypothetical protein